MRLPSIAHIVDDVASIRLLRLLSGIRTEAVHIGHHITPPDYIFKRVPCLARLGRNALVGDGCIDAHGKVMHRLLNERALGVSCAEECQVDDQERIVSLGEREDRKDEAEQKSHLQRRHETHASIVVLLDEPANGLGERGLLGRLPGRLGRVRGRRGSRSGTINGWLQSGNQVAAGVGRNVEDRVHGEWEERQRDLARVEPHQSHSYSSVSESAPPQAICGHSPRYCTFSSVISLNVTTGTGP